MREIKEDLKINRFKLEEECSNHSNLYFYYAEKLADAKKDRDDLKNELRREEAVVELSVRGGDVDLGIKITESAIKAYLNTESGLVKLRKRLAKLEYEVSSLSASEESMRQRKGMIDNLNQLWIKEYYSDPSAKKFDGVAEASNDMNKQLNEERKGDN